MGNGETDREKQNGDHNSVREATRPSETNVSDFQQADILGGNSIRNEPPVGGATAQMESPLTSYAPPAHEVIPSFFGINCLIVLYLSYRRICTSSSLVAQEYRISFLIGLYRSLFLLHLAASPILWN